EGLEYLPKSCERLYCNSDWQYKSIKIAEEEDKANKFAIPLIPTERLFTIRINIKKFLGEWGQKSENSPTSRATSATGGVLALTGQPIAGGALAAASPFVEAITSHIEEN
ncbi:11089_t:CDS:2, partial [Funneliformis geosporum]